MPDQPQPARRNGPLDVGAYDVLWWQRPGLESIAGRLHIAGREADGLARTHGTPLFVYDLANVRESLTRLRAALQGTGMRTRVRVALKAQRDPE